MPWICPSLNQAYLILWMVTCLRYFSVTLKHHTRKLWIFKIHYEKLIRTSALRYLKTQTRLWPVFIKTYYLNLLKQIIFIFLNQLHHLLLLLLPTNVQNIWKICTLQHEPTNVLAVPSRPIRVLKRTLDSRHCISSSLQCLDYVWAYVFKKDKTFYCIREASIGVMSLHS